MKLLIVEDDELIVEALIATLSQQNYTIEVAADGQSGWELIEAFAYDLILLDVTLPILDGISLCRQIRSHGYSTLILLLTARGSGHDKAIGLDAGADDYVVKPFDPEELVARIRALLRRGKNHWTTLEWGALRLDPQSHEATYAEQALALTPKEYALLELFLRNPSRVFSCGAILENIWSFEDIPGEEAVRTHIKGLRHKLKTADAPVDLIETVYGIGYRLRSIESTEALKPAKHSSSTEQPEPNQMSPSIPKDKTQQVKQQTLAAIAGIWNRFRPKILEQVNLLEQAASALLENTLTADLRQQAQQQAHTLAGSLGTFDFETGSRLARDIEQLLHANHLSHAESHHLYQLVRRLRQEVAQPEPVQPTEPRSQTEDDRPLVLMIEGDRSFAEQLKTEATDWGLRTEIATDLATAMDIIHQQSPRLIVLDLNHGATVEETALFLANLNQSVQEQSVPMPMPMPVPIVLLQEGDRLPRLETDHTLLHMPLRPAQVLKEIVRILHQSYPVEATVLAVDDDLQVLSVLRAFLQPWGIRIATLDDPHRFWDLLEVVAPDLLILDVKMPHISGIELCQQVRNHPQWCELPIIVLTAYTDTQTVNQVFAAGADDFVSKPIVGPELLTRIISRLERVRLLKNLTEIDPLTKLVNRQKATQDLIKLIHLAQRYEQPFCIAILNINQFQRINQRHGYAIGDELLCQVGQQLRRSLRTEDIVARWSGEGFVIGLYGMSKKDGVKRLSHLLKTLQQTALKVSHQFTISVTLSAGLAQYPDDGNDVQSLYQAAMLALNEAKPWDDRTMAQCVAGA